MPQSFKLRVIFRITGHKSANALLVEFPAFRKSFNDTVEYFVKYVSERIYEEMMKRVPRYTGHLLNKTKMKQIDPTRYMILVGTRYGVFQEIGYSPSRHGYIPIEYIEQHYERPGSIGERVARPRFYVYAAEFTPFIKPAFMITRRKYKKMWKDANKKFIKGKQSLLVAG